MPPPPPWSASMLALPQQDVSQQTASHPPSPYFDFSWVLSGDRLAAPLQVFDDGRRMWLQFSPSQGMPQLSGRTQQGWMALDYAVQGAYVVLNAVWPQLQVKAGGREARVERQKEEESKGEQGRAESRTRLQAQDAQPARQESASIPHAPVPPL